MKKREQIESQLFDRLSENRLNVQMLWQLEDCLEDYLGQQLVDELGFLLSELLWPLQELLESYDED